MRLVNLKKRKMKSTNHMLEVQSSTNHMIGVQSLTSKMLEDNFNLNTQGIL